MENSILDLMVQKYIWNSIDDKNTKETYVQKGTENLFIGILQIYYLNYYSLT